MLSMVYTRLQWMVSCPRRNIQTSNESQQARKSKGSAQDDFPHFPKSETGWKLLILEDFVPMLEWVNFAAQWPPFNGHSVNWNWHCELDLNAPCCPLQRVPNFHRLERLRVCRWRWQTLGGSCNLPASKPKQRELGAQKQAQSRKTHFFLTHSLTHLLTCSISCSQTQWLDSLTTLTTDSLHITLTTLTRTRTHATLGSVLYFRSCLGLFRLPKFKKRMIFGMVCPGRVYPWQRCRDDQHVSEAREQNCNTLNRQPICGRSIHLNCPSW